MAAISTDNAAYSSIRTENKTDDSYNADVIIAARFTQLDSLYPWLANWGPTGTFSVFGVLTGGVFSNGVQVNALPVVAASFYIKIGNKMYVQVSYSGLGVNAASYSFDFDCNQFLTVKAATQFIGTGAFNAAAPFSPTHTVSTIATSKLVRIASAGNTVGFVGGGGSFQFIYTEV